MAPLRRQEIDHAEVFSFPLKMSPEGGQEVHMRVAAVPPLASQIAKSLQGDCQRLLTWLNRDDRAQRFVLESMRGVDHNLPARQPALTHTVDVGVRGLAKSNIAADVSMPRAKIVTDMLVVTMR